MDKVRLEMDFLDIDGKRFRLSIEDPKEDIDGIQVETAMEDIIEHNIFESNEGDLSDIDRARIVTTSIQELAI